MALLSAQQISKKINGEPLLVNINLNVKAGMRLGIAGETGSGKSSLLQILGGRGQADQGTVWMNEKKVPGIHEKLVPGHPGIAYLSQDFELPPHYYIHEILAYASEMPEAERFRLYEWCRIGHLISRRTNQLSGGERQRVALARELSVKPELLLMDEPFSNLDAFHRQIMKEVLADLSREMNITQVMVSHEAQDLLPWADEIIVMQKGSLIQKGKPIELYQQPENVYVAGLLGEFNLVDPMKPAFAALPFEHKPGSKWLIRPEDMIPAAGTDRHLMGILKEISFRGAYYAGKIQVEEQDLLIYLHEPVVGLGERLGVRIAKLPHCI
jgi:ABC-type Fe3+/spermidine/putrescine transport system ATPase subunit